LAFLRTATQQRLSAVEKLDALAKLLPDGMWMEQVDYRDALQTSGRGEPSLVLRGACWLPDAGQTLRAISAFVQQVKQDAGFFRGFATVQANQTEATDPDGRTTYRTFQMNCQSSRRVL
jgi:Tfp pilus assembly protein PilN